MTTVFLVTDEPVLGLGLQQLCSETPELTFAGQCRCIDEMQARLEALHPDVVLLEISSETELDLLPHISAAAALSRVVLWGRSIAVEIALQAISAGARGLLRRTLHSEDLVHGIQSVHRGEMWLERELTDALLSARRYSLTRREGQVIALLAQGMKNKEIAWSMRISEGSVKVYLSRLFQKLNVKDRYELALFGLRNLAPGAGGVDAHHRTGHQFPLEAAPRAFFVGAAHT
jgi:DNA-binding NarL/FixJ family response regulator